jgi:hypothetical protein
MFPGFAGDTQFSSAAFREVEFLHGKLFCKFLLSRKLPLLFSASRNEKRGCKKRKRDERRPKKIEENSKFRLTDQNESLQCTSRRKRWACSKEQWFFQLQGLQIATQSCPDNEMSVVRREL